MDGGGGWRTEAMGKIDNTRVNAQCTFSNMDGVISRDVPDTKKAG